MIYPRYPDTYWSFRHALRFISKKAVNPPLGLLTVSAMLPEDWSKKIVDLNFERLTKKKIKWADLVFISAMNIQKKSVIAVIEECKSLNKRIVAGGPLFSEEPEQFPHVDYLILNEAELTLPDFLKDLKNGNPKQIYQSDDYADIKESPLPDYSLVQISKYNTMNIQMTRGCPFNCDFCDITALLGHKVRIKTAGQILDELNAIYRTGWRGNVFFVDDNFIGNKILLKETMLPSLIDWMEQKKYPFSFTTEASINLSDDNELMKLMAQAGFSSVFIGIETTELASLQECGKNQNINRDMVHSVRKIQDYGIAVNGGFILGFDNDTASVFQNQIDFIRESGIISAMVGLLNAPRKTRLYKRLMKEGRITRESTGDNTDFTLNFIPKMDKSILLDGYSKVINGIYGGKEYYDRVRKYLVRFKPNSIIKRKISLSMVIAFFRSHFRLGIVDSFRRDYWSLIFWTIFNRPELLSLAVTYSVYGFHFRKIFKNVLK